MKIFNLLLGVSIICLLLLLIICSRYLAKNGSYPTPAGAAELIPTYTYASSQISSLNTTSSTTNSSFLTYQSKGELGMTMKYPLNWKTMLANDKVLIFLPPSKKDNFPEKLVIALFDIDNNISVNRLSDQAINNYARHYDDFFIIGLKPITFHAKPAYVLSYSYTNPTGVNIVAMDIGIKDRNKAYVISYSAEQSEYHTYISTVQKMINSFRVIL